MKNKKQDNYDWQIEAEREFGWTPSPKLWFELMSWITAFATLKYLSDKTHSIYITAIYWISYTILFNHMQRIIWTSKFQKYLPGRFNEKTTKIITYVVTALLVTLVYWLTVNIVEDLSKGLR